MGAECDVNIVNGYPNLINDDNITQKAKKLTEQYIGNENVIDMEVRMTAEDFSYFALAYPSTMYRLGTSGKAENTNYPLHSAHFDIDESVLQFSHGLIAWIAANVSIKEQ